MHAQQHLSAHPQHPAVHSMHPVVPDSNVQLMDFKDVTEFTRVLNMVVLLEKIIQPTPDTHDSSEAQDTQDSPSPSMVTFADVRLTDFSHNAINNSNKFTCFFFGRFLEMIEDGQVQEGDILLIKGLSCSYRRRQLAFSLTDGPSSEVVRLSKYSQGNLAVKYHQMMAKKLFTSKASAVKEDTTNTAVTDSFSASASASVDKSADGPLVLGFFNPALLSEFTTNNSFNPNKSKISLNDDGSIIPTANTYSFFTIDDALYRLTRVNRSDAHSSPSPSLDVHTKQMVILCKFMVMEWLVDDWKSIGKKCCFNCGHFNPYGQEGRCLLCKKVFDDNSYGFDFSVSLKSLEEGKRETREAGDTRENTSSIGSSDSTSNADCSITGEGYVARLSSRAAATLLQGFHPMDFSNDDVSIRMIQDALDALLVDGPKCMTGIVAIGMDWNDDAQVMILQLISCD